MKKNQQIEQWKELSKSRAKREFKARVRFKKYKKAKNKRRLHRKKFEIKHENEYGVNIVAPKVFSLIINPEETIKFINKIEWHLRQRKKAFIVLTFIEEIDYGAIAVLFSIMDLFTLHNVKFNGNKPNNATAFSKLESSGFFKQLYRENRNKIQYRTGDANQIFTKSNKQVESALGLPVMVEATEAIWGEKRLAKGLQRILVELMHNTNNHAGGKNKKGFERWCLSVNHDKSNRRVEFVFVDYGVGIFNSLNQKQKGDKWYGWQNLVQRYFQIPLIDANDVLLKKLLSGEIHLTVTKKDFRGKGLPGIKEVFDRNQISNLFILSNNAYADVAKDNYVQLAQNFSGTFLYWELCYSNENHIWTVKS